MTVSATSPTAAQTDTVALGRTSLAQNFNMFLTLLTTQMKNQDPTSPLDSNQFTAQLVQMTGVEQQLAGNDLLKQLVANTGTNVSSAVGLIGKQVRAASSDATLADGKAQWHYNLDADTSDVKIEVLDANGKTVDVVAPATADSKAGDHTFTWDGKDLSGATQPNGVYTLRLTTRSSTGASIATGTIFVEGRVTGVEQANGQTVITVNGGKVPLGQVTSVTEVASNSNASTPADQTSAPAA